MFSEDDKKLASFRLADLSIPAGYHDQIIAWAEEGTKPQPKFLSAVVAVAVLGAWALLAWGCYYLVTTIPARSAIETAKAVGGRLIYVNTGFGFLIAFLPGIMLAGFSIGFVDDLTTGPERKRAARSLMLVEGKVSWFTRSAAKRAADHSTTAEDVVARSHGIRVFRVTAPVTAVFLLGLVVSILELRHYYVGSPKGVEFARLWPPSSTRSYTWDQANGVTLGCNTTDDSDDIIYIVRFTDGQEFRLGDVSVGNGSRIPALEDVDARLPPSVIRRRWEWLGRDAMAARCLSKWSDTAPDGYARLLHLLRVGGQ